MTTISNVSTATTAAADKSSLSQTYNQFLKLLVTQMQNQDPLNPSDSSQFTQQLVSYSNVEQQIKSNTYLSQLVAAQGSSDLQNDIGYIGKDVVVKSDKFAYTKDATESLAYELDKTATNATVTITDANGNPVRTLAGDPASGIHAITWDGKDNNGNTLAGGIYKISVTAPDTTNTNVGVSTYVPGTVTSVVNNNGVVGLMMNGTIAIDKNDIIKIGLANA